MKWCVISEDWPTAPMSWLIVSVILSLAWPKTWPLQKKNSEYHIQMKNTRLQQIKATRAWAGISEKKKQLANKHNFHLNSNWKKINKSQFSLAKLAHRIDAKIIQILWPRNSTVWSCWRTINMENKKWALKYSLQYQSWL